MFQIRRAEFGDRLVARWATAGCTTSRNLATFSISFLQVSLSLESTPKVLRPDHLIPAAINITVQRAVTLHTATNISEKYATASFTLPVTSIHQIVGHHIPKADNLHSANPLSSTVADCIDSSSKLWVM